MKILALFTLFFIPKLLFGQNLNVDKRTLKKLFKIESGQVYKEWLTCNAEKDFADKNTLSFVDNINYFYQSEKCCEFINWKFYKKNMLTENESQICKEPSTAKVTNDIFKVKIIKQGNSFYLIKSLGLKLTEKFLIESISKTELQNSKQEYTILTLLRIK